MKLKNFVWKVIFLLFLGGTVHAQNYIHYSTENGLPSAELYNGLQDEDGFILINSVNGLVRFDGIRFSILDVEDGLTDNDVIDSRLDKNGTVWLTQFDGSLCTYKDGIIQNSNSNSFLKEINHKLERTEYVAFGISQSGYVIFSQRAKNKFFVVENMKLREFNLKDAVRISNIFEMDNRFYLSSRNYFYCLDSLGREVFKLKWNYSLLISYFWKGQYYGFGGSRELNKFRLNDKGVELITKKIVDDNINESCHFMAFNDDKIYYASNRGICCVDTNLNNKFIFHQFPKEVTIRSFFIDRQKNLWVVTQLDGLYLFPLNKTAFDATAFSGQINDFKSFDNESKIAVLKRDELLWSGSKEVLRSYKLSDWQKDNCSKVKTNESSLFMLNDNSGLLVIDRVSGAEKILSIPKKMGVCKDFDLRKKFIAIAGIWGVHIGALGKSEDVYMGRTTSIKISLDQRTVYVGTLKGVFILKQNNGIWTKSFLHESLNKHVLALELDSHGILWVQEQNRIKAFYQGNVIATLNRSIGLVSKTINRISIGNDRIVVATNSGVSIVNYILNKETIKIEQIANYNKENGLHAEYLYAASIFNNELIVRSKSGLSAHGLYNSESTNSYRPKILSFRANGLKISLDSLQLNYKQNYIAIDFASLIYGSQPESYSYRLLEQGEKWQVIPGRTCDFLALSPGKYTFQLKANYELNNEFGEITELIFEIEPAFWQSIWFKVLLLILLILLIFLIVVAWYRRRNTKFQSEKDFALLKMQALKAQMNPHFIFNSLNSIQSIVNSGDIELSNKYIVQFSNLIRQSLNYASIDHISLSNEIEFLNNYIELEKLRFEDCFTYSLKIDEGIDPEKVFIPPMFLQIYLENAIKHGVAPLKKKGYIEISFAISSKHLICSIDDNGIGRQAGNIKKDKIYTSKGTLLNEERVGVYKLILEEDILINWVDKVDELGQSQGTRVELKIPLI